MDVLQTKKENKCFIFTLKINMCIDQCLSINYLTFLFEVFVSSYYCSCCPAHCAQVCLGETQPTCYPSTTHPSWQFPWSHNCTVRPFDAALLPAHYSPPRYCQSRRVGNEVPLDGPPPQLPCLHSTVP